MTPTGNVRRLEPDEDVAELERHHRDDFLRRVADSGHPAPAPAQVHRWWLAATNADLAARAAESHGDGRT